MKTNLKKQYADANTVLLFLVSMLLGYNIYQEIYHPEKSDLLLCAALVALTASMVRKYGLTTNQEKQKEL